MSWSVTRLSVLIGYDREHGNHAAQILPIPREVTEIAAGIYLLMPPSLEGWK
jgi:hypothetical protein